MAIVYSFQHLTRIIGLLPRRPPIAGPIFSRIKELAIYRPFRGRGLKTVNNRNVNSVQSIPVRITNRDNALHHSLSENSRTVKPTRNLINLSNFKKIVPSPPSLSVSLMNCRSVNNKASLISDTIIEKDWDCVALTETWLSSDDENNRVVISSLVPEGYNIVHIPRATRGGGVGFVYKKHFKIRVENNMTFSSFECMTVIVEASSFTFRFIVIYRVPPSNKNGIQKSTFISEFGDLLVHCDIEW